MTYIFLKGWFIVVSGALLIGIGSIITIFAKDNLRGNSKALKVVFGTFLICFGSIITTFGWNYVNKVSQKKSMLISIMREWEINNAIINKEPVFDENNIKELRSYRFYPRFKMAALHSIITSGLFDTDNLMDIELLQNITDYEVAIEDVNARLSFSDNHIISISDMNAVEQYRKSVVHSIGFVAFKNRHLVIKSILIKQYSWLAKQKFLPD